MAENDIYNNEKAYKRFVENIDKFTMPPSQRGGTWSIKGQYYCKDPANIEHFKTLFDKFDLLESSYIRRLRLLAVMRVVCFVTEKNLADCQRPDIDKIVLFVNRTYKSEKSKSDFKKDLKWIWKRLFPEKDALGRDDDTLIPYVVKHLSGRIDRSRQKARADKLNLEEFEQIIQFFEQDKRIQAYLMVAYETLARPQEILFRKMKDVAMQDNYARIDVSDHGKEGIKPLLCIDSYPYLIDWISKHPFRHNPEAYLFINLDKARLGKQLKPFNINKKLKIACKHLGINKPMTCYSFKRNGVTMRRLRGDSDVEIQHTAGWTSTRQLSTYDMSNHEEAFKIALVKRGLLKDEHYKQYEPKTKPCPFCNETNGFNAVSCGKCKRPLDRKAILENEAKLKDEVDGLKKMFLETFASAENIDPVRDQDKIKKALSILRKT